MSRYVANMSQINGSHVSSCKLLPNLRCFPLLAASRRHQQRDVASARHRDGAAAAVSSVRPVGGPDRRRGDRPAAPAAAHQRGGRLRRRLAGEGRRRLPRRQRWPVLCQPEGPRAVHPGRGDRDDQTLRSVGTTLGTRH